MKKIQLAFFLVLIISCKNNDKAPEKTSQPNTFGSVIRFDAALNDIIDSTTKVETIAEGFEWSEGPLWVEQDSMLLFSDVPMNTIYKWTAAKGKEIYLTPSGYTGATPSKNKEPGSNGLILDASGHLVLCQHGNRQMAKMDAPVNKPTATFITLANVYDGKKFNSPNDAVYNSAGELFFTDPPYGLGTQDDTDPMKEQKHNGVYKVRKDGSVRLLVDSITRPNGIAFLPGEKQLIVACSDPAKPNWYIFDVAGDSLANGRIFANASNTDSSWHGLPDGLKVNKQGTLFASGPGGIYILNSQGKKLGLIRLEHAASNCALSADEKTLFITNDMNVLKVKLK